MASGKSNYLNNLILNHVFNGAAFTSPTSVQCALFTTAPTASTSGTEVSASGTAYARVTITANTTNFATTTTQTITNANPIIFPTASASWNTVVAAAFFDNSGTNMLYFGTLTSSVAVANGNTFEFLAGGFTVTEA